jgi:hypothetical protein
LVPASTVVEKKHEGTSPLSPVAERTDAAAGSRIPPVPGTGADSAAEHAAVPAVTPAGQATLEQRIASLEKKFEEQSVRTRQVVNWVQRVSGPETLQAKNVPMGAERPVDVQEFGLLRIVNRMSADQKIAVNGADLYTVEAKGVREIKVRVGTVTTQITGESPISWFIGPQNYVQEVIIAPAVRNPLANPPARVWQYDPLANVWFSVSP